MCTFSAWPPDPASWSCCLVLPPDASDASLRYQNNIAGRSALMQVKGAVGFRE